MSNVFYGNNLLPYLEGDKLKYDSEWVTPALSSVKEVQDWLSKHPDLDAGTSIISEYKVNKDGSREGIRDFHRDGKEISFTEFYGEHTLWIGVAHRWGAVHPRIFKHAGKEDEYEFFQSLMQPALNKEQPAYCNGCGAYHEKAPEDRKCSCGSVFYTYSEILEQVNWF